MIRGRTFDNLGLIRDLAIQLIAEAESTETLDKNKVANIDRAIATIKADEQYNSQLDIILGRLRKADCTIYDRSDEDRVRNVAIKAGWLNDVVGRRLDLEFYEDFSAKLWLDRHYPRVTHQGSWGGTMSKAIELILEIVSNNPAISLTNFMKIMENDERAMTADDKVDDTSSQPKEEFKYTYVQGIESRLRQLGCTIHDLDTEDKEKLIEIKASWKYLPERPAIKLEFYSVGGAYVVLDDCLEFHNTWNGVISMAIDYSKKFTLKLTK